MRRLRGVLWLAGLLVLLPEAAGAVPGGFFAGIGLQGSFLGGDAGEGPEEAGLEPFSINDSGGALSLRVGYLLTPGLLVRLAFSGANHDTKNPDAEVGFTSLCVEAAYVLRPGRSVRPFVFAGAGGFGIRHWKGPLRYDVEGGGLVVGGGTAFFVTEGFALDVEARGDFIDWDRARATEVSFLGSRTDRGEPLGDNGSAAKLHVGLTWWP